MAESDFDDQIRQLLSDAAEAAPDPPPLPSRDGLSSRRRRRVSRRSAIAALAAAVVIVAAIAVGVARHSGRGVRITAIAPTSSQPAPSPSVVAPRQLGAALLPVAGVTPVLAPTPVPGSWSVTMRVVPNGFDVTYRGPAPVLVELSVSIPNLPPPVAPSSTQSLAFRGDPQAQFYDANPSDPASRKMLAWWEPGRWDEPIYAHTPHALTVPYFLNAVGVDSSTFWAIADSLRPVAAIGAGPAVSLVPDGPVHDGETVQVELAGFPPDHRVRLSECASAADAAAAPDGCGAQAAQQPFADLDDAGSATTSFVVRDHAATKLLDPAAVACDVQCVLVATDGLGARGSTALTFGKPPPAAPAPGVVPTGPTALAVAPNGNLYIADDARNEILERLPSGAFTVVAGTGTAGYSGDGGRAVDAAISDPAGMAFGSDGTLYFADDGNQRVRAISPAGTITTVAGTGAPGTTRGFVAPGTPALRASIFPSDVTIGAGGRLYIATGYQVLRVDPDGTLTPVVGADTGYEGVYGVGGPATRGSADGVNSIAFDAAGNLYLFGFNTKDMLVVTPSGTLTQPPGYQPIYPRGNGGLVHSPDGSIVAMSELEIVRLSPTTSHTIVSFYPAPFHGIRAFSPNGIAISPDGTIFVDTYYGNGYTDTTAIASIRPDGTSSILWKAS